MNALEKLYDYAYEIGIDIYSERLSDTKKAVCLRFDDFKVIALDKSRIETGMEEKVILAEEIGHYETNSMYGLSEDMNTPFARANRGKAEYRAKAWRTERLLPPETIQSAIYKCYDEYNLADYLDVPINILREAIEYWGMKGVAFDFPDCG